ncbi:RsmB/NOP family class I SAM-dependent RNA methyltransferase [Thiohalobacter sp. IOR34]|uniref:RsmB/NOP family class I SAM-dependent RNA methyltransferase n=1 Tax=Thiohalobacter sp. IOR34 TaxID=3057176 RepID=UPI0025B238CE|nr:RsmB/NOP family class I SAM-dependent RNA methyltransferase [Thiohalobacter sp. IOR34]WJW74987.1 RsmB/NOP family class I SAM-dependent RNA methyltransferase [Thiohalobacter sp. IOR34]
MSDAPPEILLQRLQALLPDTKALAGPPPRLACRANPLRGGVEAARAALQAEGLEPQSVDWLPGAFTLPSAQREALSHSKAVAEGAIYIQNLSSMLPPWLLDPQPGEEVLDLAAAPGSKTTQMAGLMQNRGRIAAVEAVRPRFFRLRANLAAQGVEMVQTYLADGSHIWRKTPERFDRVLLDAPCSSEGRIRLDQPASYAHWSPAKIRDMARKQGRLLFSAVQCLKPGGRLLYSTCSFAPEENEAVLDRLLRTFGDALEVLPVELPFANWRPGLAEWQGRAFAPALAGARRILPAGAMEGFFLCLLEKRRSTLEPKSDRGRRPHRRRRR